MLLGGTTSRTGFLCPLYRSQRFSRWLNGMVAHSYGVQKRMLKKVWSLSSQHTPEVITHSSRQELMQGPWWNVACWLAPHALLSLLCYSIQDHLTWTGTAPSELGLLAPITNQQDDRQTSHRQSDERILSSEVPASQKLYLLHIKLTNKTKQDTTLH